MEKKVLVVSENEKSFMTHALVEALEREKMDVTNIMITSSELENLISTVSIVLIRGGDICEKHQKILHIIKTKCAEKHRKIVLYGAPEELEPLKRIFPIGMLADEYLRPVDVSLVAEHMSILLERLEIEKGRKKILVVDDSSTMLRTIMSWLEKKYQVMLANSATKALAVIQKDTPDLILLDYEMPVCSGGQLLEMLRSEEETKRIPVIFLTSRGDTETVKSVLALKPEGYILKTESGDKVIETLDKFFEKQFNKKSK